MHSTIYLIVFVLLFYRSLLYQVIKQYHHKNQVMYLSNIHFEYNFFSIACFRLSYLISFGVVMYLLYILTHSELFCNKISNFDKNDFLNYFISFCFGFVFQHLKRLIWLSLRKLIIIVKNLIIKNLIHYFIFYYFLCLIFSFFLLNS